MSFSFVSEKTAPHLQSSCQGSIERHLGNAQPEQSTKSHPELHHVCVFIMTNGSIKKIEEFTLDSPTIPCINNNKHYIYTILYIYPLRWDAEKHFVYAPFAAWPHLLGWTLQQPQCRRKLRRSINIPLCGARGRDGAPKKIK